MNLPEGRMDHPLRLSQGAFVTFTGEAFRLGHAQDPLRVYEIRRDILHLLAAFAEPVSPDSLLDRLRLSDRSRAALLELLANLHVDGILEDASSGPGGPDVGAAGLAERELVKVTSHAADIAGMYPEFVDAWRAAEPNTLTSIPLGFAWWNACRHVSIAGIPGAVVECGVWRGGSMILAAHALAGERQARPLYLYDTFDNWAEERLEHRDGIVSTFTDATTGAAPSKASVSEGVSEREVVSRLIDAGHPADRIVAVRGRVQDTIPAIAPDQIALLRLDTDFYDSTRHELEHLYPRLVVGGVLLVDDYARVAGATRAVDEYFATHGITMLLNRPDVQGRIGVKVTDA